jgi:hypothetical protein
MRDIEIYGNDLIVATHGRGFWVIDDISPLRQLNDSILKADAYLFKPADAIDVTPTDDNGTPLQKDEPQAPNPPDGATIDYYLKANATGDVTLEILDASGKVVHTFSTNPANQPATTGRGRPRRVGLPSVSPLWQTTPEPFSGAAGMHRVVGEPVSPPPPPPAGAAGGGGFGRGEGTRITGTFIAKLTANGKSYTQTFTVKPDPRHPAT